MKLEILMSCMHQTDDKLVRQSRITGDVIVINQCDHDGYNEYPTQNGMARMFHTTQRGLTKSRNMAIEKSTADICLLCDDDETLETDYEARIMGAYEDLPQADVIVFKIRNWRNALGEKARRLRFPHTMMVSSIQLSFRRQSLDEHGIQFDEFLGAGSGNGAEEELKFLTDCEKAGLKIFFVPVPVAALTSEGSTWFGGFTETFFENRGASTRYILGPGMASLYAVYYIIRKRGLYQESITPYHALRAIFRGIREDKISKQAQHQKELEYTK